VIGNAPLPPPAQQQPTPQTAVINLRDGEHSWDVGEHSADSTGKLTIEGGAMRFAYRLGPGIPSGQYAALAGRVGGGDGVERVTFTARADRPMRVSLQIRLPRGSDGRRWRRSVYLEPTARTVSVALSEFEPADMVTTRRPIVTPLDSVLFVVDTLNSATGSAGTIWVSDVTLGVGQP